MMACSDEEYTALRMVALTARGLWGHYPFEDWREMNARWSVLGQRLALLQNIEERRNRLDLTAERCRKIEEERQI